MPVPRRFRRPADPPAAQAKHQSRNRSAELVHLFCECRATHACSSCRQQLHAAMCAHLGGLQYEGAFVLGLGRQAAAHDDLRHPGGHRVAWLLAAIKAARQSPPGLAARICGGHQRLWGPRPELEGGTPGAVLPAETSGSKRIRVINGLRRFAACSIAGSTLRPAHVALPSIQDGRPTTHFADVLRMCQSAEFEPSEDNQPAGVDRRACGGPAQGGCRR